MRLSNFLTTSRNVRIAADQANYDIVVMYLLCIYTLQKPNT